MLSIGRWSFDPASRDLAQDGLDRRRLAPKAAGVLLALAEAPGQVWSRDALLERVWPDVIVGEEVLTHAIAELRRALGDDCRAPLHVETVHKSGYRLVCAVARVADAAGDGAPDAAAADESIAHGSDRPLIAGDAGCAGRVENRARNNNVAYGGAN